MATGRARSWNRGKFGDVYPQWMSVTAVRDRGGRPTHYIAIASDLTERKRAEARIERLARFDSLTGLANRSLLRLRAEAGLAERKGPGQGFALLHIGLDEFSTINDSLGHGLGDVVLVHSRDAHAARGAGGSRHRAHRRR